MEKNTAQSAMGRQASDKADRLAQEDMVNVASPDVLARKGSGNHPQKESQRASDGAV